MLSFQYGCEAGVHQTVANHQRIQVATTHSHAKTANAAKTTAAANPYSHAHAHAHTVRMRGGQRGCCNVKVISVNETICATAVAILCETEAVVVDCAARIQAAIQAAGCVVG